MEISFPAPQRYAHCCVIRGETEAPGFMEASTFAWVAGHQAQDPEKTDLVVWVRGIGPRHVGIPVGTTLFPADARLEDHGAFGLPPLLQPADAPCGRKRGVDRKTLRGTKIGKDKFKGCTEMSTSHERWMIYK